MTSPFSAIQSRTLVVPLTAGPSSSPVISRLIDPHTVPAAMARDAASTNAPTAHFMSVAPRPYSTSSIISAPNGSTDQESGLPSGTTSVCPAKQKFGASVPNRAYRLSISGVSVSENLRRWQTNPRPSSAACKTSRAPASAGVMLGQRIRSRESSTASTMAISPAADR